MALIHFFYLKTIGCHEKKTMKMLTRDGDQIYLESVMELLESNGIPASIQGTETARMIYPRVVFEPSLWIYLNGQFEDAVNLINDPNYKVTAGIDVEEFYSNQPTKEETNTQLFNLIATGSAYVLVGILAAFLFVHLMEST